MLVIGLLTLIFGLMGTLVGGLLLSMCLVGGGILCDGTLIGDMGFGAMKLGLPLLIAGLGLWVPTRRALKRMQKAQTARASAQRAPLLSRAMRIELALPQSSPEAPAGPVSSKCPECGGPVEPNAPKCEWCGQPFL